MKKIILLIVSLLILLVPISYSEVIWESISEGIDLCTSGDYKEAEKIFKKAKKNPKTPPNIFYSDYALVLIEIPVPRNMLSGADVKTAIAKVDKLCEFAKMQVGSTGEWASFMWKIPVNGTFPK